MDRLGRWSADAARKSRLRKAVTAVVIGVSAAALISLSRLPEVDGFLGDLMLELGAGLLLVMVAGLWLDRFLREYRIGTTHEHRNLPFDKLIDNVGRSKQEIRILTTWTGLLEPQYKESCLRAFRTALDSGAEIKILLADPDSEAAEQRTRESGRLFNTRQKTMENLRELHAFREGYFGPRESSRFEVRLYSVMPGVQMYAWDDKAYVSFYPIGQITFDSSKLETFVSTPLGAFVTQRFDELWHGTDRTLDHYMRAAVAVRDPDGLNQTCEVTYIRHDGAYFVGGTGLERWSRRSGVDVGVIFLTCDGALGPTHQESRDYDLREVGGPDEPGQDELLAGYRTKYSQSGEVVLFRLIPR